MIAISWILIYLIGIATIVESFPVHPPVHPNQFQHKRGGRPSRIMAQASVATNLSPELLQKVLDVAIDASKKAGEIIIGNAGGAEVTNRKANSRDLLTRIDPLCEKVRSQIAF